MLGLDTGGGGFSNSSSATSGNLGPVSIGGFNVPTYSKGLDDKTLVIAAVVVVSVVVVVALSRGR